jgi:hypothetical protein
MRFAIKCLRGIFGQVRKSKPDFSRAVHASRFQVECNCAFSEMLCADGKQRQQVFWECRKASIFRESFGHKVQVPIPTQRLSLRMDFQIVTGGQP